MDEGEFRRLLERFPVVRTKNHARVEWNSLNASGNVNQGATAGADASTHTQANTIESLDSLATALDKFLAPYFASGDIARVSSALEKSQSELLAGLCLEDINDICAQFVNAK